MAEGGAAGATGAGELEGVLEDLRALSGEVTTASVLLKDGGSFSQVRIKGEGGHVLLVGLEGGGTLAATTGPDARVGLVLYDMRNTRKEVEKMIGFGEGGQG